MRKMNPDGVRADFDKSLDEVHDFYKTVKAVLSKDKARHCWCRTPF